MLKGYWHIIALSVVVAFLALKLNENILLLCFGGWFVWWYLGGKVQWFILLIFTFFLILFFQHIPLIETSSVQNPPIKQQKEQQVQKTGKVVETVKKNPTKIEFYLKDDQTKEVSLIHYYPNKVKKHVSTDISIRSGMHCQLKGKLKHLQHSTNPGQFDFARYLKEKNISTHIILASLDDCDCRGDSILGDVTLFKERLQNKLASTYKESTYAWMNGMIFGDDSYIPSHQKELFNRWSLSHLLAISGLHVGLAISIFYIFFTKTGIFTREWTQHLLFIFLPFYAFVAGGEPSVWRASLMALFLLFFKNLSIKMTIIDIISLVFLFFVVLNPYTLFQVGFQLSFLVSFALILSKRWLSLNPSFLGTVLKISFISQMVILPIQLAYFKQFNPLSILVNVLVVPYFSIIAIPVLFLLLALTPIPLLRVVIESIFLQIHSFILNVLDKVDQLFYFPWLSGAFPSWFTVMYYILLLLLMIYLEGEKLTKACVVGFMIPCCIVCMLSKPYLSPYGSITLFDIGQGDALLMELPFRKAVILYDVGATISFDNLQPSDRVFQQVLKPALDEKGIHTIDAIFLSHEDTDHMGSVSFLIEAFDVREVIISPYFQVPLELAQLWQENGTIIRRVRQNEFVTIGNHPFKVLSPSQEKESANENSLVLYSEFNEVSWLFTGDIGKQTEREIIQQYPDLQVDVLRVGHHGSKTSTDEQFIEKIQPTYGLISVGRNNRYGHPVPEVLDVLNTHGIEILRTDKDGAIIYRYKQDETHGKFLKWVNN